MRCENCAIAGVFYHGLPFLIPCLSWRYEHNITRSSLGAACELEKAFVKSLSSRLTDKPLLEVLSVRNRCRLGWQSRSNQVSGPSLSKMGIFGAPGGDFRQSGRPEAPSGKAETCCKGAKARHLRAFLAAWEGASRMPEWLAGAGGIEPPNGGIKIRLLIQ